MKNSMQKPRPRKISVIRTFTRNIYLGIGMCNMCIGIKGRDVIYWHVFHKL